jgi:hypothetical protein
MKIKLHNMGREEYHLPRPPNFIRRVCDDFPVPYGELSDAQIKKVGAAWTKQLLARAAEQRKNQTTFDHIGSRK